MKTLTTTLFFACLTFGLFAQEIVSPVSTSAVIEGYFERQPSQDTITLTLWDDFISDKKRNLTKYREFKIPVTDNYFRTDIDSLSKTSYVTLAKTGNSGRPLNFLEKLLCSPGDSIHIQIKDISSEGKLIENTWGDPSCDECEDFVFSGNGAEKYKRVWQLKKLERSLYKSYRQNGNKVHSSLQDRFEFNYDRSINHVLTGLLAELDKYRIELANDDYQLIKADLIGNKGAELYSVLQINLKKWDDIKDEQKEAFLKVYKQRTGEFEKLLDVAVSIQVRSANYPKMLIYKSNVENTLFHHVDRYDRIKSQYSGLLLDRLLTSYLLDNSNVGNADSLTRDALGLVQSEPYNSTLSQLLKDQQIGALAYDFALPDSSGNVVRLSDFRDKLVFIDFWFTGCAKCSDFYKKIVSNVKREFQDNPKITFVTISIDASRKLWLKGLASGLYTSPDAVNLYTDGQGANHPIIKQLYVSSYPHPLLIGAKGEIVSNDVNKLRFSGSDFLVDFIKMEIQKL